MSDYKLELRSSKRDYFSLERGSHELKEREWDIDLLRALFIAAHQAPDVSDIYVASGEEVSLKCSRGNLPVSLSKQLTLNVTPSKLLGDFFNSVNVDFYSVVNAGDGLSMRVSISEPGTVTKYNFRLEACKYSNGPESTSALGVLRPTSIPPDIDKLKIHSLAKSIVEIKSGMVLFLGSTGTGKSTSIFSILRRRSKDYSESIFTIENPIEYDITSPRDKQSRVMQLDINDFGEKGFNGAMHSLVRFNPDTVLVGEMRDLASVETALAVSRSDHQLFSTVHVDRPWNVPGRIFEIINSEGTGRGTLMIDFLQHIHVMVAQRLVKNTRGGKTAMQDVLIITPEDKAVLFKTYAAIRSGKEYFEFEGQRFRSDADAIKYLTYRNEQQGRGVTMERMLKSALDDGEIDQLEYMAEIEKLKEIILE